MKFKEKLWYTGNKRARVAEWVACGVNLQLRQINLYKKEKPHKKYVNWW